GARGIQTVPQVDEVRVALEKRIEHGGVGLGTGGDSLRGNALEQTLRLAVIDGDLPVEQLGQTHAHRGLLVIVLGRYLVVGPPDQTLAPERQHRLEPDFLRLDGEILHQRQVAGAATDEERLALFHLRTRLQIMSDGFARRFRGLMSLGPCVERATGDDDESTAWYNECT